MRHREENNKAEPEPLDDLGLLQAGRQTDTGPHENSATQTTAKLLLLLGLLGELELYPTKR